MAQISGTLRQSGEQLSSPARLIDAMARADL